jgi:hypothetical protein
MSVAILSQWYREDFKGWRRYGYWRSALRKYAPDVPILLIDNGGPTRPPYHDVEVIPAVEMVEHGRGTPGHYANCWRSMAYGMEVLAGRGVEHVIFIGQNLIVGTEFVEACVKNLVDAPILANPGCLDSSKAFYTEYLAARPAECRELWDVRLPLATGIILEVVLPYWCRAVELPIGPFPRLRRARTGPVRPTDTFLFHNSLTEIEEFCGARAIYPVL